MIARRRERLTFDALEDLIVHLRGIREERKAILTVTEGWRIYTEDRRMASVVRGRELPPPGPIGRTPRERSEPASTATGTMLRECEADRVALLRLPVQVSERPDPSGRFRWIVADATLAPLAAGDYAIEVTLGTAKHVAAFKVVP